MHGEFPRYRWLAIELSGELGGSSAMDIFASARLGVRVAPVRGLWFGIYPIHPAYAQWNAGRGDHWVAQSSADVTIDF
jgi:hypothetical protein